MLLSIPIAIAIFVLSQQCIQIGSYTFYFIECECDGKEGRERARNRVRKIKKMNKNKTKAKRDGGEKRHLGTSFKSFMCLCDITTCDAMRCGVFDQSSSRSENPLHAVHCVYICFNCMVCCLLFFIVVVVVVPMLLLLFSVSRAVNMGRQRIHYISHENQSYSNIGHVCM